MILPNLSESEILQELLNDYEVVKRKAKKLADSHLSKSQKRGYYIREDQYFSYDVQTPSNNKWKIVITYNQTNKIAWHFSACCISEGNMNTRDYYIVRGVRTEHPYFIKLTTHALKRWRERNNLSEIDDLKLEDMACTIFEHRETAISTRYIDTKFAAVLHAMDDVDDLDTLSYVVLTNRGIFYGKKSKDDNYIFKTYISSCMGVSEVNNFVFGKPTKWDKEGKLLYYMIFLHQYYNPWLYEKYQLEGMLYKNIGRDAKIVLDENSSVFLLKP